MKNICSIILLVLVFVSGQCQSGFSGIKDSLTSPVLFQGVLDKQSQGGKYSENGWSATKNGDYLLLEIVPDYGFEGFLEVDINQINWKKSNTASGKEKIHFISMFSNPVADHHAEQGGSERDALWSIRGGMTETGEPRYGNNFKFLWAAHGAKRTNNSNYTEKIVKMPSGWSWDHLVNTFRISWSAQNQVVSIKVNGILVFSGFWEGQLEPLKYIYLAKSPDFHSFIGPNFKNLKLGPYEP